LDRANFKALAMYDIHTERQRQDRLWGEQNHHPMIWMSILGEEYGELCQATNDFVFKGGGPKDMRTEAVQVAAVAMALIEYLDRAEATKGLPNGGVEDARSVNIR